MCLHQTPTYLVYYKIGTGDNAEEFKCYRIALAHACPYFDGEHHKSLSI